MAEQRIAEKLLGMPLFQGMSRDDLNNVITNTRLVFIKYSKGKSIVNEGNPCTSLLFLLAGTIKSEQHADDKSYAVSEYLEAPNVIQPEHIFGLTQRYTKHFTAQTDCNMISISKNEVMRLMDMYEIFRLNLLNIVCTQTQKVFRQPWRKSPNGIRQKITRFAESHCTTPAGKKYIKINMETLGHEIAESRLNVSRELKLMHSEGIITLNRGGMLIPAFERMLQNK